MSVLDIIVQKNLIDKDNLRDVRKQVAAGSSLDESLMAHGVKQEDIVAARSEFLNIPIRALDGGTVPFEALDYIPEESAAHYRFAPVDRKSVV